MAAHVSSFDFSHRKRPTFQSRIFLVGPSTQAQGNKLPNIGISGVHDGAVGLYIHWPFCRRRCRYCDFAIVPVGAKAMDLQTASLLDLNYTNALLMELAHTEKQFTGSSLRIQSIYFGGGTPSLAPIESLAMLMDFIYSSTVFQIEENCETTIEVDPGTFTLHKLEHLKQLGFNRLSCGIQSFDDETLSLIGRTHRMIDIESSLEIIRQVYEDDGGLNWSIDLISGLPGVSLAKWIETLEIAVSLHPQPTHISVYDLQVEQGTVFGRWFNDNDGINVLQRTQQASKPSPALPSPEDAAFMYKYAAGYLNAQGYEHYEVSSYALRSHSDEKSYRSRHNQIYWQVDGRWLAFGLGASSYIKGAFMVRPREFSNYIQWVNDLSSVMPSSNTNDDKVEEHAKVFERLTDIVLKRLRTSDGLDLFVIRERFGEDFFEAILRGSELALSLKLASYEPSTGCLKLKDPDGFLFSNSIISSIFVELELSGGVSDG